MGRWAAVERASVGRRGRGMARVPVRRRMMVRQRRRFDARLQVHGAGASCSSVPPDSGGAGPSLGSARPGFGAVPRFTIAVPCFTIAVGLRTTVRVNADPYTRTVRGRCVVRRETRDPMIVAAVTAAAFSDERSGNMEECVARTREALTALYARHFCARPCARMQARAIARTGPRCRSTRRRRRGSRTQRGPTGDGEPPPPRRRASCRASRRAEARR